MPGRQADTDGSRRRRQVRQVPGRLLLGVWLVAILGLSGAPAARAAGEWSSPNPIDPAIITESVSCASSSFCVSVGFSNGGGGAAAVYKAGTWREASLIEPRSQLTSVSCPTTSFCMAMDGDDGALLYNGKTWSEPVAVGTDLTSVSCVSSSFCAAVGGFGEAAIYDGSSWSVPVHIGKLGGLQAVSCSSESFCMAIAPGGGGPAYEATYNGARWSEPTEFDSQGDSGLQTLSCASASFCVAAGNYGDELAYNGSSWSKSQVIAGVIDSVSCRSESFCVALSPGGETATYNGSSWHSSGTVDERAARSLSCPTEAFCVAAGGYGATFNGSTWSHSTAVGGGGISSISCPSASSCTAVDAHGRVLTYEGSKWSSPTQVDPEGGLSSISCPSTEFCAAVGGSRQGEVLTYNGSSWSSPGEVDSSGGLNSVSCGSETFCVALSDHVVGPTKSTYALVYDGNNWSEPREVDPEAALQSVSCSSSSMCMAVGEHDSVTYLEGTWSAPEHTYAEGELWGVSCTSALFCAAVTEHFSNMSGENFGEALIYNGFTWSAPSEIPHAPERGPFSAEGLSCVSSSFCVAIPRFEGAASIYEGGAWSAWMPLEPNGKFSSVSCPSVSFCVVANWAGQVLTYFAPASTEGSTPERPAEGSATPDGHQGSTSESPQANPPIELQRPFVKNKTGEIVLEYEFPEPGRVQLRGEVMKGARLSRIGSPAVYGRATSAIATAGRYKFQIRPDKKMLAALRQRKTLRVRLTLEFAPAGTTSNIQERANLIARSETPGKAIAAKR